MMKAEKQPLVRIYRAAESGGPSGPKGKAFKREPIREWSGLLIAYEVVDWFKSLQSGPNPILDYDIAWPSQEELGLAMRRFKARGRTQHDSSLTRRPSDPAGYLVDAELAFSHGLTDFVFPYEGADLEGERLETAGAWVADVPLLGRAGEGWSARVLADLRRPDGGVEVDAAAPVRRDGTRVGRSPHPRPLRAAPPAGGLGEIAPNLGGGDQHYAL